MRALTAAEQAFVEAKLAEIRRLFPDRDNDVADALMSRPWSTLGYPSMRARDALVHALRAAGHSVLIAAEEWT